MDSLKITLLEVKITIIKIKDLSQNERGLGRELFNIFRENATAAKFGGGII